MATAEKEQKPIEFMWQAKTSTGSLLRGENEAYQ